MKTALFIGLYSGLPNSHGGERRTSQLREIVSSEGYTINHLQLNFISVGSLFKLPLIYLLQINKLRKVLPETGFFNWSKYTVKEVVRMRRMEKFVELNLNQIQNADVIFFENSFPDFIYLPYLIKQKFNKNIVACLHNIEALVPLQYTGVDELKKGNHLLKEVQALQYCNSVFTISREEQWLLQLFKINAQYLPYFPDTNLYNQLFSLREQRKVNAVKSFFLVVGSVTNPPTKNGIEQLLNFFMHNALPNGTKIIVAGFGTETLIDKYKHPNIQFEGAVTAMQLEALMIGCKAAIVNQGFSTGALTKNIEYLIAGIPVLCDEGSIRSYYGTDGIYRYNSFVELGKLMETDLIMPSAPILQTEYNNNFRKAFN